MNPTIQSAAMTDQEIHDWWLSENGLEDCEMCNSEDFHQVVRAVEARLALAARPVTPAPEDGWSTITVKNIWPLLDALARADDKGYMPDAMADEWAAFDYRDEPPASAPEALSDEQIDAIQRDYMASYPCDVRRFARMIERAALAAPSTPAPDIADAVMDPDGVCPTCYQRLHVEHASTEALGVDAAIRWIRDNYQDHNIASLCDGLRALAAPSTPAAGKLGEDALKDLAHSAYEEAMSFGLSVDVFMRYFRTIALAAPSTPAAEEASTDEILADLGWQKVECAVCGGYAHAAPSTPAAVAYVDGDDVSRRILWRDDVAAFDFPVGTTLFAAAPSTPAAALTDDEIDQIWAAASEDHDDGVNIHELARAIERYHGIGIEEAP